MNKRCGIYGVGQKCEQEAADYLTRMGYLVIPISEFVNNTGGAINAPMVISSDGKIISPDLFGIKKGKDAWFEVKDKSEPTYFWKRHEWQHGIDAPNMYAYRDVQNITGKPIIILIHERLSPKTPDLYLSSMSDPCARQQMKADLYLSNQWLSIRLDDALMFGEERGGNFKMVRSINDEGKGFYWPRSKMTELQWGKNRSDAA